MSLKKQRGYQKQLLVLPFDHRASFQEKMFGIQGVATAEQTKLIASYKMMIYEGFEKAVASGLPKAIMGILTDEQFGAEVLDRARENGFTTSVCVEKSGQDEFDFEYADYMSHIKRFSPDLVKVLVRYNPESDAALNHRQAKKLQELSRNLDSSDIKFMFELLVPPTDSQLAASGGDRKKYDLDLRPGLMVKAMTELLAAGVEPDVWKLEGLDRKQDFEWVCKTARTGGRDHVGCIVLGRGENEAKVREWLSVGANVAGVVGFAVGRTVFWEPLKAFRENKMTRDQAIEKMAATYGSLCRLWLEARA